MNPSFENAPRAAVSLVSSGKAQVVMKGLIHTADYLRAILDKEIGLRKDKSLLSTWEYFKFLHLIDLSS